MNASVEMDNRFSAWKQLREASRRRRVARVTSLLRPGLRGYKRKKPIFAFNDPGLIDACLTEEIKDEIRMHPHVGGGRRSRLKLRRGLNRRIPRCVVQMEALPSLTIDAPAASIEATPGSRVASRKDSFLMHLTPVEGIPEKWMAMKKRESMTTTDVCFTPIEGVLERMMFVKSPAPAAERVSYFSAIEGVPERQQVPAASAVAFAGRDNTAHGLRNHEEQDWNEFIGSTGDMRHVSFHHEGNTRESHHAGHVNEIQAVSEDDEHVMTGNAMPSPTHLFWDAVGEGSGVVPSPVVSAARFSFSAAGTEIMEEESIPTMSPIDWRSTGNEIIELNDDLDRRTTGDDMIEVDESMESEHSQISDAESSDQEVIIAAQHPPNDAQIEHSRNTRATEDEDVRRSSLLGSDMGMRWVNGCRRSTRNRCKPLRWWDGEHKVYGREHNTLATVTGYVKKSPDPEWPRPSTRTTRTKRRR